MCHLRELHLDLTRNHEDYALLLFANALANKFSLETVVFDSYGVISEQGWEAVGSALCNTSNAASVRASNHTLLSLRIRAEIDLVFPEYIRRLLRLNQNRNKAAVSRQKTLLSIFS